STIKVWHAHLHTLVWTLSGHQRWVWDIAFSSDTAYLVSASSDHTAKLWDMKTGTWIREYKGHQKAVVAVGLHDQMVMPGGINVTSVT
ncbi:TOR complex subunit lst8, partial [Coelomomyces lativittatus]